MTAYRAHRIVPSLMDDGLWESSDPVPGLAAERGTSNLVAEDRAAGGRRNVARCAFRPEPSAVRAARQFTRAALTSFGAGDVVDDASVIVSELVTNAVRHGIRPGLAAMLPGARIELVVLRQASQIMLVVTDSNPEPPVLMDPDEAAETGRGLCVVGSLSSQWGWAPLGVGRKAVWAALPLAPARELAS